MMVQARYLFILYYLNLKFATTVRPKLVDPQVNKMLQMTFINQATSSFIMDDILKKADHDKGNFELNLKIFMLNIMKKELHLPNEFLKQNTLKLMYMAYIATEYYYSLSLCTIWAYTTQSDIDNKILFLPRLKKEGILDKCQAAVGLFRLIIQNYTLAVKEIETTSTDTEDTVFNIKRRISKCAEDISNISILHIIDVLRILMFDDERSVREYLYKWSGDNAKCLIEMRQYLQFSIFAFSKVDFRGIILTNSSQNFTSTSDVTSFITYDEQFTWRNVINVNNMENGYHPLENLSKCEQLRNELSFYMLGEISQIHPLEIQRNYKYPHYIISFRPDIASFEFLLNN